MMRFTIEKIPTFTLAYMRRIGEYGPENIALMNDMKRWANDHELVDNDSVLLGIPHDDPQVTEPEDCCYDVGIVIDDGKKSDLKIDDSISITTHKMGLYAVFTIAHTMEAIAYTWAGVFEELINAGIELDISRSAYERYRSLLVENHLCEICIPIK